MKKAFEGFFQGKKETFIQILLVLGILVVANYLADQIILRFDLTENNRYTLSEASRNIAENVDDPITVTAYFSGDLPPQLSRGEDVFRNFLDEFRAYSGNNLEYKFINPNKNKETEQEAQQAGIRPVMLDVRKRDQVSQKRAYFGAVFNYKGKRDIVPVIRPGSAMEYTIASTIKKLTIKKKPKIGILQGHGEPGLNEMKQLNQELSQRYDVQTVSGIDTTGVPADLEVLMIISPKQEIPQADLKAIDQYIMSGGKAIFAINRVRTMLQRGMAAPLNTGVDKLLAAYHLPVNADLVRDINASTIRVQQQQGGFSFVNQIQYPYIPQIHNFAGHPISKGLENVMFQFVSSLDTTNVDSTQQLTVLARTSDKAGESKGYFNLNPMRKWTQDDFQQANIPLAGLLQGKLTSAFANVDSVNVPLKQTKKGAIIVFGDGDFIVNGAGQQAQQLPDDNINLVVNSVDWLADDTGLIALRTQGVTSRPLENIEDSTKAFLKYFNVFFPILLVLGYGVYRYQRQKARRRKWIEQGV